MSGKDETDLVRNKELSPENSIAQSTKSNHDLINGDASAPVNGDSSTNLEETSKQNTVESTPKPSTPSNWVQFENEDDSSDKVYNIANKLLINYICVQKKNHKNQHLLCSLIVFALFR